ncbi:ABC transporter family substrate-binding protein [Corynebacterium uterequi]|uniref:Extracellular solute-binding protein, family 5 n=1 Tax=Corynebacterium uterequi TaxID=1072256 RepID=A0A0G3HBP3_9CORY|nr:ABC transporter family substrate-binding protein [Corynebacterium uterequi]AKK10816.1 extracellular solute-binding protein, family 5 [Corynebacterium uterequi]
MLDTHLVSPPRRLALAATSVLCAGLLAACVANPGPPPLVDPTDPTLSSAPQPEETRAPEPAPTTRSEISVGVEGLRGGLNPHLLSDTNPTVDAIADLTLPSAFIDGDMNDDLLVDAESMAPAEAKKAAEPNVETEVTGDGPAAAPVQQVLRYRIHPEAQWSDGTPITGADFIYLWKAKTHAPGVINAAPYEAISAIRTSNGGRAVEVDLTSPVIEWESLFSHLLPSHLAAPEATDFAAVFYNSLPAAGGRYLVDAVDRSRGIITLHRNDRFWGADPAHIEILHLHTVTGPMHAADLLRSGQTAMMDLIPQETTITAVQLLPGMQSQILTGPRQLRIDLNTESAAFRSVDARAAFTRLVDVPLLAQQATGRRSYLAIPDHPPATQIPGFDGDAPTQLSAENNWGADGGTAGSRWMSSTAPTSSSTAASPLAQGPALTIGYDGADATASAAARTLKDLLARHGIDANTVVTDLSRATSHQLPDGELDMLVYQAYNDGTIAAAASQLSCPDEESRAWAANLTGYCTPETEDLVARMLGGAYGPQRANALADEIHREQHLSIPIVYETRILARGDGIVVPALGGEAAASDQPQPADLSTAATWTLKGEHR